MTQMISYESPGTYGYLANDRRRGVMGRLAIGFAKLGVAPLPFLLVGFLAYMLIPLFGLLATPAVVVLLIAGAMVFVRTMRKRRGAQVLSYIEQAVRLNLPLPRMLWAAESSEQGALRKRLRNVRLAVEAGVPVGIALEMLAPEVPDRSVQLIKASERLGRLPVTLRRLVRDNRAPERSATARILSTVYPIGIAMCLMLVLGLLGIFVIPKFELIMRDFDVPLPWATQLLLAMMRDWAVPAIVAAGIVLLLYSAQRSWEIIWPRNTRSTPWGWMDAIAWRIPVLHAVLRDRGLADAFAVIAEAVEAGYPLDRAVTEASELRINLVLRRTLERWLAGINSGLSPEESARAASLPPLVSGMVATAGTPGGAQVYWFLSRYYDSRYSRLASLLRAAVGPALSLIFGVAVGLTAMGMFMPLIELMRRLSVDTGYW